MLQPGLENLSEVENVQRGYVQEIQSIIENLGKVQNNFSQAFQGLKDSGKVYEEQLFKISTLSNQIHEERIKDFGMFFHRLSQGGATLHIFRYIFKNSLECRIFTLFPEN